jgi:hypothetical protein
MRLAYIAQPAKFPTPKGKVGLLLCWSFRRFYLL